MGEARAQLGWTSPQAPLRPGIIISSQHSTVPGMVGSW